MKLLRALARKLHKASLKVDVAADKIQGFELIPAKIRAGYFHHSHMLKGALNNHIDESTIVADLSIKEYTLLVSKQGNKSKTDRHIVKGVSFYAQNDNLYFVLNNGCKCTNCGIQGTRLVVCTPTEKEVQNNRRAIGYVRCIAEIGGKWYQLTVDHIKPKAKGGTDEKRNLQILCMVCNQVKNNYEDQIPFHSHIIPTASLKTQLGMWINAAVKWHNIGGARLTTIGS